MHTAVAPKVIVPSAEQARIFAWFRQDQAFFGTNDIKVENHLVVSAYAGTGKSTTILEGVKQTPRSLKVLIAAFSKLIEQEMVKKIGPGFSHVTVKTLHALGLRCVNNYRRVKVQNSGSERADGLTEQVCGKLAPDAIKRLVSKLHTKGRDMAPHARKIGDLTAIAITHDCTPDETWQHTEYAGDYVERKALEAMELASNIVTGQTIDYADMIFLPVRNRWMSPDFDRVVIDEAQDMTVAQLELAQGMLKPGGLMAVVGDRRQAIFAFRGADSRSMDRLKAELHADELTLSTTYRCGRAIVKVAQRFVPDYRAGDDNCDGTIDSIHSSKLVERAAPGDFILSRTNAPLVPTAMQLLRAGKRARVAGREIGAGLKSLVRKLRARNVEEFVIRVEGWSRREVERLTAQMTAATNGRKSAIQSKIDTVADQADMLTSLSEGANDMAEIEARIDHLFSDVNGEGVITCSSVHRAKGLEAGRVFILADTLRENNEEELNIQYVAITRAIHTLVWVYSRDWEGSDEQEQQA